MFQFAGIAVLATLTVPTPSLGQPPTFTKTLVAPADGNSYTITMIGGDPFSKSPSAATFNARLVPVVLEVFTSAADTRTPAFFDAQAPDTCDPAGLPATIRFLTSPLVQKSDLKFNGIDVGKVQFSTGFKRAEFWNKPGGPLVEDTIVWTELLPVLVPAYIDKGDVVLVPGSGCTRAVVSQSFLGNYLKTYVIPSLQESGAITTSDFVLFLANNVVQSKATPADESACCENGANGYDKGQGWAWANYDSYGKTDIQTATHEVAEWTNDPFASNSTPAWGNIGEAKTCGKTDFQVGDPINTATPIKNTLNGFTYHLAELAYFGWFYDGAVGSQQYGVDPGAGGVYSSNGTFIGPHNACPVGGTFPPKL